MATLKQERTKIFISYSHKDEQWLARLRVHLRSLEDDYDIDVWDDTKINPGLNWREEIKRAVELARVAVLLVSADFLASRFIVKNELPPLLRAAAEDGATILPVILSPSRFIKTNLSQFQAINHPSKPLISLPLSEQEEIFYQVTEAIELSLDSSPIAEVGELSRNLPERIATELPQDRTPLPNLVKKIPTRQDGHSPPIHLEFPQLKSIRESKTAIAPLAADAVTDLAINFDGYQTTIFRKDGDILLKEPSLIAIDTSNNMTQAVGDAAEEFLNGVGGIATYRPIYDSKVFDSALTKKILQQLIYKACGNSTNVRPRIVIAVASDLTQVERRALITAAYGAKAFEVYLVERIFCAAIGAGLSTKPHGNMIAYVGDYATELISISHDGHTFFKAGNVVRYKMDEVITQYILRKYNLLISEHKAREIKNNLGSAFPLEETLSMDVRGHNRIEGIPKTITITDQEVREALADSVTTIVNAVRVALEWTPPEIAADITEGGIVLTGSGALLKNLDKRISTDTGLPVSIVADPSASVIIGSGRMLSDYKLPIQKKTSPSLGHKLLKAVDKTIRSIVMLYSHDLAIDIGTRNTLIFAGGRGIVVSEPSITAINKQTHQVEVVGRDAKEMLGRTPDNIVAIRPMKDGVIANFEVMEKMLQHFIRKAHNGKTWVRPRVVISIPSSLSKVEHQAYIDTAYGAKAAEVYLVEQMICAAIGAGLFITEPHGNMIVDVGGGTTDIAVISLSGIAYSHAIRVGGNEMDEAITQYIKRKYNLLIGERTAEVIKIEIGSAWELDEPLLMEVRGRNLIEGIPKTISITDSEIGEALADPVLKIVNAVRVALERTPPELAADIVERGIMLTGGGALLKNLDKRLSIETGLPVSVAEDPLSSVVLGAGKMLHDFNLLKRAKWSPT